MLTEGVEWALHSCILLSLVPRGRALPAARLAEFHDLPAAYLAKQLQQLSAAGIAEPVRGKAGGYRLARSPGEITVLDVVEAVEGIKPIFRCAEIRRRGPCAADPSAHSSPCAIAATMADAEEAWRSALASRTLADLMAAMEVPAEGVERSRLWFSRVFGATGAGGEHVT